MSLLTQGKWLRRFGLGAVAAAALVVTSGSMAPAQAHDYRYGGHRYAERWSHHEQYRHYGNHHRGNDARRMVWLFGQMLHR